MKKLRITAFILTLVLLIGALPISAFATKEVETESVALPQEESILASLANGKKLYTGPTIGENDVTVYSSSTISASRYTNHYKLVTNQDGSSSLVAKVPEAALTQKIGVNYTADRNNGAAPKAYEVFTTNIIRGEDFFNATKAFVQAKVYYENGGSVTSTTPTLFRYNDQVDIIQTASSVDRAYLGTEAYTNLTIVVNTATKKYDSYINGKLAAQNISLGLAETATLHSIQFYADYTYGAEHFPGVYTRHGITADFYTDIYPTITAMNGVYEFEGNYYYYENGALFHGTTVENGGYILELAEGSGRIINCYQNQSGGYTSLSADEIAALLTAAGGNAGSVIKSTVTTSIGGAIKNYLNTPIVPYAYEDGTIADASARLEVISADFNANTHFTFKTKRLGTNIQYYKTAADLASGTLTTPATELQYEVRSFNGSYASSDFVIKYPVKFGEGINTLTLDNGSTKTMSLLRAVIKNEAGTQYRPYVLQLKRAEGENAHLILCGVDVGPCDTENITDITFKGTFAEVDGIRELYFDVYVNGELKVENYNATAGTANSADRFYCLQLRDDGGLDWSGEFITFYPTVSYSGNTNLEAVTDSYSGVINHGKYSVCYENGSIKEYGNYETLCDKYGYTKSYQVEITGYNVALSDILHLNFYVKAQALATDAGAYALFTIDDREQKVMLSNLAKEADGSYKLTANLSSIEMDTDVALSLYDGNGVPIKITKGDGEAYSYTHSIRRYCEYVVKNAEDFTTVAVDTVKALLTYGAAAEAYFSGDIGYSTASILTIYERQEMEYHRISASGITISRITGFANPNFTYDNITNIPVTLVGYTSDTGAVSDVYFVLDSAIKIRIALTADKAPESVTGAKLISKTDENGKTTYYVDIEGLAAKDLNKANTVTVDGVGIIISGMAVASTVINSTNYSQGFVNLMKAMVAYYYYSSEYASSLATA